MGKKNNKNMGNGGMGQPVAPSPLMPLQYGILNDKSAGP